MVVIHVGAGTGGLSSGERPRGRQRRRRKLSPRRGGRRKTRHDDKPGTPGSTLTSYVLPGFST